MEGIVRNAQGHQIASSVILHTNKSTDHVYATVHTAWVSQQRQAAHSPAPKTNTTTQLLKVAYNVQKNTLNAKCATQLNAWSAQSATSTTPIQMEESTAKNSVLMEWGNLETNG